jgi:hypothetical protein
MKQVATIKTDTKIKLYISSIDNIIPNIGKLGCFYVINEIMYYYNTYDKIDELCLSDTYGSLRFLDFKYIIDELIVQNVDFERFSLHLQQHNNKQNLTNIIVYAMKNGISRFDVSNISELGDCIVTMDKYMDKINGNLHYEQIYECL